MHDQKAMVEAHKQGCEYARRDHITLSAEMYAGFLYPTEDERYAFVAGYEGTLRRMKGKKA